MSRFRPGQAEAIVERARAQGRIVAEFGAGRPGTVAAAADVAVSAQPRRAKQPNQTEREYEAMLRREFPGAEIRWEALTLRMASLVTYTPDYIVFLPNGSIECHEVKGGFIFPKALVKPRLAAEAFPWRFVLAQKRKGGEWEISTLNGIWTRNNLPSHDKK